MTGLEALKEIFNIIYNLDCGTTFEQDKKLNECRDVLKRIVFNAEKSLKALEIIKKKCLTNCNLALVKDNLHYQNYCKEFEYFLNKYNESPNGFEITKDDLLTQEEFDLLKEMLE